MNADDIAARAKAVDEYFVARLGDVDPALAAALAANAAAGLPAIDVSPLQGKLLHILARSVGAKRILEIGTLGGFSTIWLARALAAGGEVVTLELNPKHADVARANLERAGQSQAVRLIVGKAADSLDRLIADGTPPFDLIFIDADKPSNPTYLKAALALSRPGTLIVLDNVVRNGRVADPRSAEADVVGVRQAMDLIAAEPRLVATAVQTVGRKGYDGFVLAYVA